MMMAGERILIVEDEFLIRATLVEVLEDEGYEVVAADSGEAALDLLRADGGVALLMTDVNLGGSMNGTTLAAAARSVRGEIPVVFMTGRPDQLPPLSPGREAFVNKPYTTNEVTEAVRSLLPGGAG